MRKLQQADKRKTTLRRGYIQLYKPRQFSDVKLVFLSVDIQSVVSVRLPIALFFPVVLSFVLFRRNSFAIQGSSYPQSTDPGLTSADQSSTIGGNPSEQSSMGEECGLENKAARTALSTST